MGNYELTSLLYFLAIGFFFYWMMKKGGCGMHAHGGHDHAGHGSDAPADPDVSGATKDPVCGMSVDPKRAAGTRSVKERTFHFCSSECLAKFDADPEGVASSAPAEASPAEHADHQHHHGH